MLNYKSRLKYQSRSFLPIIFALSCIIITLLASRIFNYVFDKNVFILLHVTLDIISVALCFTVASQGWLIFSDNVTDKRIRLSAFFLAISLFDLMHLNSLLGSLLLNKRLFIESSIWFAILARITAAFACLILITKSDSESKKGSKLGLIISSIIYFLVFAAVIMLASKYLPILMFEGHGTTFVRKGIEYLIISMHFLSLVFLVKANVKNTQMGFSTLFTALLFLMLGSMMFTSYRSSNDLNYLIAHIFKVLGYLFLLRAVFYTVIERPLTFERILKEERLKAAEEFKKTIQILPNVVFKFRQDVDGNFYNVLWEGSLTRELKRFYYYDKVSNLSISMIQELSKKINELNIIEWISMQSKDFVFEINNRYFVATAYKVISNVDTNIVVEVVGFVSEITEKRRMEEALRKSQEKFVKAFNASPTIMTLRSLTDWRYLDVNEAFLEITGYTREEIINNMNFGIWLDEADGQKVREKVLAEGTARNFEVAYRTKKGEERIGLLSAETFDLAGERCVLTVTQDITEKRKLEKEMERLDRLNVVGEMAATIAHEIRNPMTTVRGFLQIIGSKPEFKQFNEPFKLMIEELDRANSIITEFLSLARNRAVKFKEGSLNTIIQTLSPLILSDAISMDKNVEFKLNTISDLRLDEKEIRQLILNLVRNGLEAMRAGGTLTISTHQDNEEVVLSIKDEGTGISPELLKQIGTPFLTTKEHGTGLGLSVCFSIAARHNANINIETSNQGTTFSIRFGTRLVS